MKRPLIARKPDRQTAHRQRQQAIRQRQEQVLLALRSDPAPNPKKPALDLSVSDVPDPHLGRL